MSLRASEMRILRYPVKPIFQNEHFINSDDTVIMNETPEDYHIMVPQNRSILELEHAQKIGENFLSNLRICTCGAPAYELNLDVVE